ncbi:M23 family metallopeptidase [Leifsonia shinshuensis]|uniref:M23 family metallopeptidase n=1 Tax=Leifsonia shinshuensis TaxID=150026 RepID=UPI001F50706A|nr:M23 family metallopeptidase [Leifsonia shinshuensis]MCI0157807.1 M23 family metallopeptidase [Leifsonia shinshuensis]
MRRETRPRNGIRAPHGADAPLTRREARRREELEQREREARSQSPRFSRGVSLLAMLSVLGIAVATTVPAMALLSHDDVRARNVTAHFSSAPATEGEIQALDSVTSAENEAIIRDSGAATSGEQLAALRSMRIADTFRNNPAGAVQWPFPVGVPISDGFGYRVAPTAGASTDHLGVDFTPGAGVPIQIIADGVVREVVARDDGGCGVNVTIDHMIGGQLISSKYCHMQTGSVRVSAGQRVAVADIVGRVGNTGISTGTHLHFEIRLNGTEPVDPVAWLKANAS